MKSYKIHILCELRIIFEHTGSNCLLVQAKRKELTWVFLYLFTFLLYYSMGMYYRILLQHCISLFLLCYHILVC